MSGIKVPLYTRLPEIYRIKDNEIQPVEQLKNYLSVIEEIFGNVHENIEQLYNDFFIETCDDWVIPYIGDLLGNSHLFGDPWTLRADVADTIALRRRKGTIGAIELLTYDLTGWGVHCVELMEKMLWNQHLNHQRPDAGGNPPYGKNSSTTINTVIRGGTVTLRDPAVLCLLNTPFDSFAHTADLKPQTNSNILYNLPNLAVFLWRLEAYRIEISKPLFNKKFKISSPKTANGAKFVVSFYIHPLGEPVTLFNINRYNPDAKPPVVTIIDEVPVPIPYARLNEGREGSAVDKYVSVDTYDISDPQLGDLEISDAGLQFHFSSSFEGDKWTFRGDNLCAWNSAVVPEVQNREIILDPDIGRILIGVKTNTEALDVKKNLLLTYTYGAVGPVGAHPISRSSIPTKWNNETVTHKTVKYQVNPNGLRDELNNIQDSTSPIVIEIKDSMVHTLDLSDPSLTGIKNEDGGPNLQLNRSLIIRAADDQRPIIKLKKPLRFRPTNVAGSSQDEQDKFDDVMNNLTVRLEGLYITRDSSFPANAPLIARAALNSLEIINTTLDPGGSKKLDGTAAGSRLLMRNSIELKKPYGFSKSKEEKAFKQTPNVIINRSVTGSLLIDTGYLLFATDSIIDAGKGVNDDPDDSYGISGAVDPPNKWGAPLQFSGITVFGKTRVESINGKGGIFIHSLEVMNNQKGCIKQSYFSGESNRLPQNYACIKGSDVKLKFVSEIFGNQAYAQISRTSAFEIRERGPGDDAMGAFGFLLEAHKWKNIQIRFNEFMPVDIRPLLLPVT